MCCLTGDELQFVNMVSANKVATLCSVDILYYVCYVVLLKLVRCPGAANPFLGARMLAALI